MTSIEIEILKVIADGGYTYSPEADGTYVMRPVDAADVAKSIAKFLIHRDELAGLSAQPSK